MKPWVVPTALELQHAAEHTGQLCDLDLVITECSESHVTEPHPYILKTNFKRRFTNLSQAPEPRECRQMVATLDAVEAKVQRDY